jgi:hypothetical protein
LIAIVLLSSGDVNSDLRYQAYLSAESLLYSSEQQQGTSRTNVLPGK